MHAGQAVNPTTRNVEAFLKKTDIAYHPNLVCFAGTRVVCNISVFWDSSTLRVQVLFHWNARLVWSRTTGYGKVMVG